MSDEFVLLCTDPLAGRFYRATQNLVPGRILTDESSLLCSVNEPRRLRNCCFCFAPVDNCACSKCNSAAFCEHCTPFEPLHEATECQLLQSLRQSAVARPIREEAFLLIRYLALRLQAAHIPSIAQTLEALHAMPSQQDQQARTETIRQAAREVGRLVEGIAPDRLEPLGRAEGPHAERWAGEGWWVEVLCRLSRSCIEVTPDSRGACQVGRGFFPHAALFNHSCLPNCVPMPMPMPVRDPRIGTPGARAAPLGCRMCVRVCAPVCPGEECAISYIDPYDHFLARSVPQSASMIFITETTDDRTKRDRPVTLHDAHFLAVSALMRWIAVDPQCRGELVYASPPTPASPSTTLPALPAPLACLPASLAARSRLQQALAVRLLGDPPRCKRCHVACHLGQYDALERPGANLDDPLTRDLLHPFHAAAVQLWRDRCHYLSGWQTPRTDEEALIELLGHCTDVVLAERRVLMTGASGRIRRGNVGGGKAEDEESRAESGAGGMRYYSPSLGGVFIRMGEIHMALAQICHERLQNRELADPSLARQQEISAEVDDQVRRIKHHLAHGKLSYASAHKCFVAMLGQDHDETLLSQIFECAGVGDDLGAAKIRPAMASAPSKDELFRIFSAERRNFLLSVQKLKGVFPPLADGKPRKAQIKITFDNTPSDGRVFETEGEKYASQCFQWAYDTARLDEVKSHKFLKVECSTIGLFRALCPIGTGSVPIYHVMTGPPVRTIDIFASDGTPAGKVEMEFLCRQLDTIKMTPQHWTLGFDQIYQPNPGAKYALKYRLAWAQAAGGEDHSREEEWRATHTSAGPLVRWDVAPVIQTTCSLDHLLASSLEVELFQNGEALANGLIPLGHVIDGRPQLGAPGPLPSGFRFSLKTNPLVSGPTLSGQLTFENLPVVAQMVPFAPKLPSHYERGRYINCGPATPFVQRPDDYVASSPAPVPTPPPSRPELVQQPATGLVNPALATALPCVPPNSGGGVVMGMMPVMGAGPGMMMSQPVPMSPMMPVATINPNMMARPPTPFEALRCRLLQSRADMCPLSDHAVVLSPGGSVLPTDSIDCQLGTVRLPDRGIQVSLLDLCFLAPFQRAKMPLLSPKLVAFCLKRYLEAARGRTLGAMMLCGDPTTWPKPTLSTCTSPPPRPRPRLACPICGCSIPGVPPPEMLASPATEVVIPCRFCGKPTEPFVFYECAHFVATAVDLPVVRAVKRTKIAMHKLDGFLVDDATLPPVLEAITHPHPRISLGDSQLTDAGLRLLATHLRTDTPHIEWLILANPRRSFTENGIICLVEALKDPKARLTGLCLNGCGLTDRTAKVLAELLRGPNSLKRLELNKNEITEDGARMLTDLPSQLLVFHIDENPRIPPTLSAQLARGD
ncbi:hypothetical protein PAPYR_10131 [Paratrimastix pyriformis]|uniref:SET domain-containing protein n=1 Tax=Paratrimastix pyriformis TaxID=342808 RepID=A0ABQ8U8D6_9EUKA|nr:hypothetical protein PAPYR_10131 [Paratrimastix pyriformis]